MDNVTKWILIIAGLVITALIIAYGVSVYNDNKKNADAANNKIERISQDMQESDWTQYDGTEITGSQVINVIKHFHSLGETFVSVDNHKSGEVFYVFSDASLSSKQSDDDFRDAIVAAKKRGENTYINPSGKFLGELVRDPDDGTILGIKFEIQ